MTVRLVSRLLLALAATTMFLFAGPLAAERGPAPDARAALDRFVEGLETFTAEFTQTVRDETGYVLQESDGSMQLGMPNRLRWEVTEPFPQTIVSDGEDLWTYDPDLSQATVRPLGDAFDATPIAAITQPERLDEHFRMDVLPVRDASALRLLLIPRNEQADFTHLELDLTPDGDLTRMAFRDIFGQETEIHFERSERNAPVDESVFTFDPPSGVDIYRP
ncbi:MULTISPECIES: outer membrane lipoprotein chaperone LolA [unclassified Thioalkalivibrio]|uniref:outer membrane lipoprotein chaperone LolA n=1 Tax=unclassified Thioalkalivibrio TaxID=2621013 RepID=UPI00036F8590|nr:MULTISPECIES: outer membrane lipoprotein chaperone LolA [unclassified Thioalkalivibrio]